MFNWGEPFLNPEFLKIVNEIVKHKNLTYSLSTNAGVIQPLSKKMVERLSFLRVSTSGFSQVSYDKIHKLNFELVKKNVKRLIENIKSYPNNAHLEIAFFDYPFNKDELPLSKKFAEELGVELNFLRPYLTDLKSIYNYFEDKSKIDKKFLNEIEENLDMKKISDIRDTAIKNKQNLHCSIRDLLTINHRGEVVIGCCAPYDDKQFIVGNYLEMSMDEINKLKMQNKFCAKCMKKAIFNTFVS